METVFSSAAYSPEARYRAWQETLCSVYVNVDTVAEDRSDYEGFVRESRFGPVTITDTLLSRQSISRRREHIARLDKDCYYIQFIRQGRINVVQAHDTLHSHEGVGTAFCASEEYNLQCIGTVRSYYLEIPHEALSARLGGTLPLSCNFNIGSGLGRIVSDFSDVLVGEAESLNNNTRDRIGLELLDLLALTIESTTKPDAEMETETTVRKARLRAIKRYIERNLANPTLSLAAIAKHNGISLRYLHFLFREVGISASDWIWHRRLQRSFSMLSSPQWRERSVTDIAYAVGFSSSSHFSNLFKATFGMRPSDVRQAGAHVSFDEATAGAARPTQTEVRAEDPSKPS